MAKQTNGELVVVTSGFDYAALGDKAEGVRSSAEKIRQMVRRTVEDIIAIGREFLSVKEALPHGWFTPWLKAEFGWTERTARHFMHVAKRVGPKTEIISGLPIDPTAAYLLAAPSAPDEALISAIERAECGDRITTTVAKEIIATTKQQERKKPQPVPAEKLGERLVKTLERYKEKWNPKELAKLARQLREFADELEKPKRAGKKK